MKHIKIYSSSLIVLVLVLILSSCGSKKNAISIGGVIVEKNQKELVTDVLDKELKYKTLSGKTKFELSYAKSKKSMKVTSVIKMIKDETIQISFRALFGYEVAVLTLTPDSIHIIDRYNKRYGSDNISKFASSDNSFNYYNLQALLTNSIFLPGKITVSETNYKDFDFGVNSNMYLLKVKDKSNVLYNFAVDGSDKLASTLIFSPKKFTLQWSYLDFIQDGEYIYPTQMQANLEAKDQRFDIKISYDKLEINKDLVITKPNPDSNKYQKVSVTEVIKQYIGL